MEWEKTKSLLILAFALVNLIFAAQLWIIPVYFSTPRAISTQQVEIRIQELRFRNILVTATVPRTLKPQRMMDFKSQSLSATEVADKLLGAGWEQVEADDSSRFILGKAEVQVYSDSRVFYSNPAGSQERSESLAKAQQVAEGFISKTLGLPGDARLAISREMADRWYFEYRQHWRRKPLSVSYLRVWVAGGQVIQMERYWAEPLELAPSDISIIPATGALLIAADHLNPPAKITGVYLSWYSEPLQAERWRVPCVWVVETAISRYYVNAFTGELEAREEIPAGKSPFGVE